MKAVILAGGLGTRLSEETTVRPKPMVEIGGNPILWHIMKLYSSHGIDDFIVCCGYKGEVIKQYFLTYSQWSSDVTIDLKTDTVEFHRRASEPWRVTLVDTGFDTMTGGRLKRVSDYLEDDAFCLTYGDGVANVDITALIDFHRSTAALATMTAVRPPGRFGALVLEKDQTRVGSFAEKPIGDAGGERAWINGGFFVLRPEVLTYIDGDDTVWEREPLERLAAGNELSAYRHEGFWQPMDTLRDKNLLEKLWESGSPPWRIW
jgi:glucose-1-phosphate cytidylyltransferase